MHFKLLWIVGRHNRRRKAASVFDGFRNFQAEAGLNAFSAVTVLDGWQEGYRACKGWMLMIWLEINASGLHMFQSSICHHAAFIICCCSKTQIDLTFWYWLTHIVLSHLSNKCCLCYSKLLPLCSLCLALSCVGVCVKIVNFHKAAKCFI